MLALLKFRNKNLKQIMQKIIIDTEQIPIDLHVTQLEYQCLPYLSKQH